MRNASPSRRPSDNAGIRCAIYTRKSTEEGLDQAFNSLYAQRETCESYILSQKHEGWAVLPQMYDDGGISGGTLDRPALKRLLADIAAGMIDTVVVYKVDRLTRSLSDFAKIVDVFEANGVTFVSVTQSFNTVTSMGRLTLNMLLSFAQFEREIAGERIRDKIAASKKKGLWMGGVTPLGYDVVDRKLVVNQDEAETVRHIFRRYAYLGSVRALQEELDAAGIVSKRRVDRFGRKSGGKPLARGALYLLLQNRIYLGEIVHKQASYPGEHKPIIHQALWETVQARLAQNRVERKTGAKAAEPSLLTGLLYDHTGERMTPTHANKKGTRYRYYISLSLIKRGRPKVADTGRRLPAGNLESIIEDQIIAFLGDTTAIFGTVEPFIADLDQRQTIAREATELAGNWRKLEHSTKSAIIHHLVNRIDVKADSVDVTIRPRAIPLTVAPDLNPTRSPSEDDEAAAISLSIPARLRRTGKETRLLIESTGGARQRAPDRSLLRLLSQAYRFQIMMMQEQGRPINELALDAGVSPSYFSRVLKFSFLAPDIVKAILSGSHPPQLTAKRLISRGPLPKDWSEQVTQLGFA